MIFWILALSSVTP